MISEELQRIQPYFQQISAAKGKSKEAVILSCFGTDVHAEIKKALLYLLDTTVVTHVGEKSFETKKNISPTKIYTSIFQIVEDLAVLPAINDQMVANIHASLAEVKDDELRKFGYRFICKNISLGVTAATVNKVLGEEVLPEFRCMLANKYFDHPDAVAGHYFYLTEKLDGARCLAVITESGVHLFSRQGQPIEGLYDIEADLALIHKRTGKCLVFDGELLIENRGGIPSKEQYKQTMRIVRKDGPKNGIVLNTFDVLDFDAFENRQCDMAYYLRRQRLETFCYRLDHIKVLPVLYKGTDETEILRQLHLQQAMDHEGIMINLAEETYQFKRTNALLKVKVMQDCDLEIIGVQQGQGKYAGTLGALIVEYRGTPVGVGSGMSDAFRAAVWADPEKYIGRVATIQYFEETNDAHGNKSIRFPVFRELREEGKEVSYS